MTILEKVISLTKEIPLGERDNWHEYFMAKAYISSLRSTCGSRRVGAVIVRNNREIASGYNGYPAGATHCVDGGCPRFEARKNGTLESGQYSADIECYAHHAEANALFQCIKEGISTSDCVIYTTTFPCRECAKQIYGSGIKTIYYSEGYPDELSKEYIKRFKIETIKI